MSIANLLTRVAELERRLSVMMVPATVHERDHKKGVRFKIADGEDGPVLSSWVRPPDMNKGVRSSHLPRVGSQAMLLTPPGGRTLTYLPMGHHEGSPDPAGSADETVLYDDGGSRISVNSGVVTIKSGASSISVADGKIELSADLVRAIGASLKHNEKSVGDGHVHTGVEPGGGLSSVPV